MHNYSTKIKMCVQPQSRFGSRVAPELPNLAVSNFRLLSSCCLLSTMHNSSQVSKIALFTIITY